MKLEDWKAHIDKHAEEWSISHAKRKKIYDNRITDYWEKWGVKIDSIIDKIIAKYESDEYQDRERKAGREPQERLFDFFLSYARKYGGEYKPGLDNMFASESWRLGNYAVTLYSGQGCYTRVWRIKTEEELIAENYKNCKDRARSILYSISMYGMIQEPYSIPAAEGGEDELDFIELRNWNSVIDDIAGHLIECEKENMEGGTFWADKIEEDK